MKPPVFSCLASRTTNNGSIYGRFLFGPLPIDISLTLATILRRSLLHTKAPFTIVSAEIEGAMHEYAALPGIQESVLEILLNLGEVVLTGKRGNLLNPCFRSSFCDNQKSRPQTYIASLRISGPCVVTAKDINWPDGVLCVKPKAHIATLSGNNTLAMRIKILGAAKKNSTLFDKAKVGVSSYQQPTAYTKGGYPSKLKPVKITTKHLGTDFGTDTISNHQSLQKGSRGSFFYDDISVNAQPSSNLKLVKDSQKWILTWPYYLHQKTRHGGLQQSKNGKLQSIQNTPKYALRLGKGPSSDPHVAKGSILSLVDPASSDALRLSTQGLSTDVRRKPVNNGLMIYDKSMRAPNLWNKAAQTKAKTEPNLFKGEGRTATDVGRQGFTGVSNSHIDGDKVSNFNGLTVSSSFYPIEKVNFVIERDDQLVGYRHRIILEVWTNGSISPRQAIFNSISWIIKLLYNFRESNAPFELVS